MTNQFEARLAKMESFMGKALKGQSYAFDLLGEFSSHYGSDFITQITEEMLAVKLDINQKMDASMSRINVDIEEVREQISTTQELAISSARANQVPQGYISQSEFGDLYATGISSNRIGRLFKVVGLAQKRTRGKTVPYNNHKPKYCKTVTYEKGQSYLWNYKECVKFIEEWLRNEGRFEEFYLNETKKDIEDYIDLLFNRYVIGQ